MIKHVAILSLLLMTACIDDQAASSSVVFNPEQDVNVANPSSAAQDFGDLHVIRNHKGGRILVAEADRRALVDWGGPVRIEGYCKSSCVIFTTLPNACLARGTEIGFHSSNINFGPVGNAQIARYLRGGILDEFQTTWQFVPNDSMHNISASEYVALDPSVRLCSDS